MSFDLNKKLRDIRQKIDEKGSREVRTGGNPHTSDIDRELSRVGKERKPDDIPKQDTVNRRGAKTPGDVTFFQSSTKETKTTYKIGPAVRPNIYHDKGFSILTKREPELNDYLALFKWVTMLNTASVIRPDLDDATAAYSHFLNGEGKKKFFSYERYVMNDNSGRITLRNAILDAQNAAIELWLDNDQPSKFSFTGPAIPCGADSVDFPYISKAFPYPATENWQKAIGAHKIWLSGTVHVKTLPLASSMPDFKMNFVLHAEDQYNFNPGQNDITTGIPDDENGRFVVCGLAAGYRHEATLSRSLSWRGTDLGVASMGINLRFRQRSPSRTR